MQPTTNLSEGTGYAGAYQHIYLILSFEMHKLILKHLTTLPSTPMSPIAGIVICHKGASIYDVRKILGFLDPPPPLSEFYVLFVRKIGVFSDPPPPQCGRHMWKHLHQERMHNKAVCLLSRSESCNVLHA